LLKHNNPFVQEKPLELKVKEEAFSYILFINTMYKTVFKACFHYLTSFDDLDGFTGGNRQMKYSAYVQFKCN